MSHAHGRLCVGCAARQGSDGPQGARLKRALSHVGGRIHFRGGSPEQRACAAAALEVDSSDTRAHVHGFHSYPARLHPRTAQTVIEGFTTENARVLDPFCGSGTTLVEARRLGRHGLGSDLNPLALELCWLKTLAPRSDFLRRLRAAAARVFEFAEERRVTKQGPIARYRPSTRRSFPVHVLLELDGLWHGLLDEPEPMTRRALRLVFSSILTKVSNRRSDTSNKLVAPRLRSGFTLQLFVDRTKELCQRMDRFRSLLPPGTQPPELHERDARQLGVVRSASIDLVLTSPPYPGVFDYLEHHLLRLDFLQLAHGSFKAREIGARRNYEKLSFAEAVRRWQSEFLPCLAEAARVLKPGGKVALVIADTAVGGRALRADELLGQWAPEVGLVLLLCASQKRPSFHEKSDRAFHGDARAEHLVLLGRQQR